jgi:hypothetical protein
MCAGGSEGGGPPQIIATAGRVDPLHMDNITSSYCAGGDPHTRLGGNCRNNSNNNSNDDNDDNSSIDNNKNNNRSSLLLAL